MDLIIDDELGLILELLIDPDDRKSASLVCKRWLLIEGLTRSSISVDKPKLLPRFLSRFPNLVQFRTSKCMSDANLVFLAKTCPKLEVLDLSTVSRRRQVGDEALCALATGCPELSEVCLNKRHNIGLAGLNSVITSGASNLTHLGLGYCSKICDKVLGVIGSSGCSISYLDLEHCKLITDNGLGLLANGRCSKTMKTLILTKCSGITNYGVSLLKKMSVLEELNLHRCSRDITDVGGAAISLFPALEILQLGGLGEITDDTVIALAQNCLTLKVLDLSCSGVTGAGVRAFSGHKCLQTLNLMHCCTYSIEGSDLECLVRKCPSLKSIQLDERFRRSISRELRAATLRKFLKFYW